MIKGGSQTGAMRIIITGATGFIGSFLCPFLEKEGHVLVVLSRDPQKARERFPTAEVFRWEARSGPPSPAALDGAAAVIHLAGESIAGGRWTRARKSELYRSRIEGTRNVVEGLMSLSGVRSLLSASAIGYYGTRLEGTVDESAAPGADFLARLCYDWEQEALRLKRSGSRVVLLRTGLVLHGSGGALGRMRFPFKLFVGGRLGSGKQWVSWIHMDDYIRAIRYLLLDSQTEGPVNLVSPSPVTNDELAKTMGRVLRRPALFPVPATVLKLLLGEMAETVLLSGQKVIPAVLQRSGFQYRFADLEPALRDLL